MRWLVLGALALCGARVVSTVAGAALDRGGLPVVALPPRHDEVRASAVPTAAMARRELWGLPRDEGVVTAPSCAGQAPSVRLVGTVPASDRRRSVAVIHDADGPRALHEGERVGGATVVEIGWREVRLSIEGAAGAGGESGCARLALDLGLGAGSLPASAPAPTDALGIAAVGVDRYELPRASIESALEQLGAVRGAPRFVGGAMDGFRLIHVPSSSLLARLGLAGGDVIERVNGRRIDGPETALALYAELRDVGEVVVDVSRGGSLRTLRYRLR